MSPLKLVALDRDDLEVVSTHLQDATVKVGEILWRPSEKRVVIGLDRFDWEAAHSTMPVSQRRRTALRFERVLQCKCRNVMSQEKHKVLNLLGIEFFADDSPAGHVVLMFEGGSALRLDVECLEVELADLGPVWAAEAVPSPREDVAAPERG
ncbi:MAG: DUF2948 family protein [Pseudorhodoplanes sp.]